MNHGVLGRVYSDVWFGIGIREALGGATVVCGLV